VSARPGRRRPFAAVVAGLVVAACTVSGCAVVPVVALTTGIAAARAASRGQERPCPDESDFECVTVPVPADHFAASSPTWGVTFAVHRGDVDSRGVLVTATGGPGSSGVAVADHYMSAMSSEITDHYDLVFIDQRGIGLSHPFRCDRAVDRDDLPTVDASSSGAARDRYAAATRAFVADCFREAQVDPADTGRYATRQAAEDLEAVRRWLGAGRLDLYGESYGTQLVQTYAAAHPDHVGMLLLDGVVDLTTDARTFAVERARAFSDVLATTLRSCDADPDCAGDAPGSSLAGYDTVARRLRAAPHRYAYPLADGTSEQRTLTVDDLRSAAEGSVSALWTREQLQRSLNAVLDGDDVPLARLAAENDGVDPGTGAGYDDPTFSQALYFAVECADYDFVPTGSTGRAQLDAWLATARTAGVDGERLGDVFYGDLPCLFWPGHGPAPRPAAVTDPPYPVLLLTADTDPNTPTAEAQRILRRSRGNTALAELRGGPHVVFGWGYHCIDDLVTGVITSGRLPRRPVTVCSGDVADPYQPAPPRTSTGYDTPGRTIAVALAALLDDPVYSSWDGWNPLTLGCDAGGTARYSIDADDVLTVRLHHCAWTHGVPVDGTLHATDDGQGPPRLSLALPFARLSVSTDGTVSGTFRGRPVS
jgi:pimeloyl-ACP methyl ester carboxylesterase